MNRNRLIQALRHGPVAFVWEARHQGLALRRLPSGDWFTDGRDSVAAPVVTMRQSAAYNLAIRQAFPQ